ncbi:MAG: TerD family protein [Candidatus Paceibacterota bacterium]|jgi:tellurium resistance protein TerZ
MAINLSKGQRINLEKNSGAKLINFCVGCNWGMIETFHTKEVVLNEGFLGIGRKTEFRQVKQQKEVDLDLSCVLVDENGKVVDYIYSPLYKPEFLAKYGLPKGKLDSEDRALHHTGDDREGDEGGDDGLDNEIITVDLLKIDPDISQIFFFLNNCGKEDFSQIPYASIRMYEGTPEKVKEVFAQYDVASDSQYAGKLALIMGKLYRKNGDWKFAAIGDAFDDANLCLTIIRIQNSYAK